MKRNLNSRKVSLIKNNLFLKGLKRQKRIKERAVKLDKDFDNEEERNLLFPDINQSNESEIQVTLENKERKIFSVKVPGSLYQKDILEELKRYKDSPMPGFRKGSINMTILDFRYGQQIRDFLVQNKYVQDAVKYVMENNPDFQSSIKEGEFFQSPFNVKRQRDCTFNLIFYKKDQDINKEVYEFMSSQNNNEMEENHSVKNEDIDNKETKKKTKTQKKDNK